MEGQIVVTRKNGRQPEFAAAKLESEYEKITGITGRMKKERPAMYHRVMHKIYTNVL